MYLWYIFTIFLITFQTAKSKLTCDVLESLVKDQVLSEPCLNQMNIVCKNDELSRKSKSTPQKITRSCSVESNPHLESPLSTLALRLY